KLSVKVQVCVSHAICENALGAVRATATTANDSEQRRTFHSPSANILRQSRRIKRIGVDCLEYSQEFTLWIPAEDSYNDLAPGPELPRRYRRLQKRRRGQPQPARPIFSRSMLWRRTINR